jgi:fatty acid amide hydrolase
MKAKWEELGIDAVIMPNYPIPAFKDENVDKVGAIREYQLIWSVIDYPAGVVPITFVKEEEAKNAHLYDPQMNDQIAKAIRNDLSTAQGIPVGIQIIGKKWEDEVVLGLMTAIDKGVSKVI